MPSPRHTRATVSGSNHPGDCRACAVNGRDASSDTTETFTIAEVSREFGLTFRTLRFYEMRGLISPRRDGPARIYRQGDRTRLALIVKGRKLGFTLAEIQQMLAADGGYPSSFHLSRETCVEQINMLERRKRDIETALTELRRKYSELYVAALSATAADSVVIEPTECGRLLNR
jgi:DNA-binding transcriptional MerR regulator